MGNHQAFPYSWCLPDHIAVPVGQPCLEAWAGSFPTHLCGCVGGFGRGDDRGSFPAEASKKFVTGVLPGFIYRHGIHTPFSRTVGKDFRPALGSIAGLQRWGYGILVQLSSVAMAGVGDLWHGLRSLAG